MQEKKRQNETRINPRRESLEAAWAPGRQSTSGPKSPPGALRVEKGDEAQPNEPALVAHGRISQEGRATVTVSSISYTDPLRIGQRYRTEALEGLCKQEEARVKLVRS